LAESINHLVVQDGDYLHTLGSMGTEQCMSAWSARLPFFLSFFFSSSDSHCLPPYQTALKLWSDFLLLPMPNICIILAQCHLKGQYHWLKLK